MIDCICISFLQLQGADARFTKWKILLAHSDLTYLRGLAVKAMASESKGREFESRCGMKKFSFCKSRFRSLQLDEAHANEINHDIHLANTLFQIKVRQKKNMASVCSGKSLFMLALLLIS